MTVEVFNNSSASPWTCPSGITSVDVECWGSGAAGEDNDSGSSSGGGGGAYARTLNITVIPGNTYSYFVGTANGNSSTVWDGGTVSAKNGSGTTGGAAGSSTGDTTYSGGNGGAITLGIGGGGGGAGGTDGNGSNASGSTGGAAGTDGGAGGDGGMITASSGSAPGGGGGGANAFGTNGSGSAGRIRITYPGTPTNEPMLLLQDDGTGGVFDFSGADLADGYG